MSEFEIDSRVILKCIINIFILFIVAFILLLISTLFVPERPTFKQVCESNNGIFIENYGRAGSSCIYGKSEEK